MIELFRVAPGTGSAYGLVSRKIFGESGHRGYEGLVLTTGETFPIALHYEYIPPDWDELYRLGPYSFSERGFLRAATVFSPQNISDKNPLFLDEIGPLELSGRGFYSIAAAILRLKKDIYITSRPSCVDPIIEKFGIKNYNIIEAKM